VQRILCYLTSFALLYCYTLAQQGLTAMTRKKCAVSATGSHRTELSNQLIRNIVSTNTELYEFANITYARACDRIVQSNNSNVSTLNCVYLSVHLFCKRCQFCRQYTCRNMCVVLHRLARFLRLRCVCVDACCCCVCTLLQLIVVVPASVHHGTTRMLAAVFIYKPGCAAFARVSTTLMQSTVSCHYVECSYTA
jgi:hypothetical protein